MIVVPNDISQKVFEGLIEQQFHQIIPHFTMELMQKLMISIQRLELDFEELLDEFQLRDTSVVVQGNKVIYQTPPANLTTFWVFEEDNYKINDFEHRVNWLWVFSNLSKVIKFKNNLKPSHDENETKSVLSRLRSSLKTKENPVNTSGLMVIIVALVAGLIGTLFFISE